MALFAISDLHLSFASDKPMSIFRGWENHIERLTSNWNRVVGENDTVIIAGDTSWAMKPEDCVKDFLFVNGLNGKKIILKGNHDYWWQTLAKTKKLFCENGIENIDILHNNFFVFGNYAVCGTRGWIYDKSGEKDAKIIRRECLRLEASLKPAADKGLEPIVFLHYPPVYADFVCTEIFDVIKKYNVKRIYYGHIHGNGFNKAVNEYDGVKMRLISCDCVDFTPILVQQYIENA